MNPLEPREIQCPYCGESIDVLLDTSVPEQHYIEDCQVCCRPIEFRMLVQPDGLIELITSHENE